MKTNLKSLFNLAGISIKDLHSINTMIDSYADYAKNINSNKIDLGFPKLCEITRGLRTKELLTVVAPTGIGKSALALNFLSNFVKSKKELAVLFSLEMSEEGIAERIFQVETDRFGFDIERGFLNRDNNLIQTCRNLQNSLNTLVIITKRIEVHRIPACINLIEEIKQKKVRLIAIDYVGLMENNLFPRSEYDRVTDNMKKLYMYAKNSDVAIINLSQTSRFDVKDSNIGLNLYSGKGSGEVENSSDFFLTMEKVEQARDNDIDEQKILSVIQRYNNRPQTGNKYHSERIELIRLTVHKNRRGKRGIIYSTFNTKNLRIKEYDEKDFKEMKIF